MTILKRITSRIMGEARDIIHGNRNLQKELETKYMSTGRTIEKEVTVEEALTIPAVEASVELITSSVANLPLSLQRINKLEEITDIDNDRRTFLLNREPNHIMNAYNFKKQMVQDYLFYGEAYIKIDKSPIRNEVQALHLLDPRYITKKKRIRSGYLSSVDFIYEVPDIDATVSVSENEMIRVLKNSKDGVTGHGILDQGNKIFRLALNELDYSAKILENGAVPLGVLQTDQILSEAAMKRLRESFDSAYQGAKNTGKTIILENGLSYKPLSLKPNDLDLGNIRKSTLSNIARLFGVPESMINSEANKYSSNEQNNIHFLQYCITPILSAIESAFNKSLLLEVEKDRKYRYRFDTSGILQTTAKEKMEAVGQGLDKGLITINEARRQLDLPDITNDDFYKARLGDVFVNADTGVMAIPNLGRVIDPNTMDKGTLVKSDILKLEHLLEQLKNPQIDLEEVLQDDGNTIDGKVNDQINEDLTEI